MLFRSECAGGGGGRGEDSSGDGMGGCKCCCVGSGSSGGSDIGDGGGEGIKVGDCATYGPHLNRKRVSGAPKQPTRGVGKIASDVIVGCLVQVRAGRAAE